MPEQGCAWEKASLRRSELTALLVVLKVLHCSFVRLCRASRGERPKIPTFSGLGILFPRVQAILTRFHFSNHLKISAD